MKKLFIFILLLISMFFVYILYQNEICKHQGFKKTILFKNGFDQSPIKDRDLEGWFDPFYRLELFKDNDTGIKFFEYIYYYECDSNIKYANRINVIKFSKSENFKFQLVPYDPIKDHYNNLKNNEVYEWSIYGKPKKNKLEKNVSNGDEPAYQKWKEHGFVLTDYEDGSPSLDEYSYYKKMGIEWLNDEPLDENHFIGFWQEGWLFKSKNPKYFIWFTK